MKFKKIVCVALSAVMLCANFCQAEVSALFGNAHFNLGKKIMEKLGQKLSESEEHAFLSGMVYADIGRFKFDKETGIDSDAYRFAEKMKEFAETSEEKWFARGFEMHVLQDNQTKKFLKEILGHEYSSYSEYMSDCGTLESYFSKKSGIIYNEFLDKFNFEQVVSGWDINDLEKMAGIPSVASEDMIKEFVERIFAGYSEHSQKNNLVMFDELIKKTYESMGFEISVDDIHEQAGNIVGTFLIVSAIIGKRVTISEDLAAKIEEKSDELADLCVSKLEI